MCHADTAQVPPGTGHVRGSEEMDGRRDDNVGGSCGGETKED